MLDRQKVQWKPFTCFAVGTLEMRLRGNLLRGKLPQSLAYVPLENLDVGNNQLTGRIDQLLADTPFLLSLQVDNNQLHGPFPNALSTISLRVSSSTVLQHHICTARV